MNFSINDILENQTILAELEKAWLDSESNISGGHQEGGFIVADDFGFLSVIRWEKGIQIGFIQSRKLLNKSVPPAVAGGFLSPLTDINDEI